MKKFGTPSGAGPGSDSAKPGSAAVGACSRESVAVPSSSFLAVWSLLALSEDAPAEPSS
jgi:hypothetical protein